MKKSETNLLLWGKRFLSYFLGLFIMAVGVVFSVRSSLGVSPVTCLANVAYQIFGVSLGIEALSLGVCTTREPTFPQALQTRRNPSDCRWQSDGFFLYAPHAPHAPKKLNSIAVRIFSRALNLAFLQKALSR